MKTVDRIIDAKVVTLLGNGEMEFSSIGFDADKGYIEKGVTSVRIWHSQPHFYSSIDCMGGLMEQNYFMGEAKINWLPKYGSHFPVNRWYNQGKIEISDSYVILFSENENKELFQKAIQAKKEIRNWIDQWYQSESMHYDYVVFRRVSREKTEELRNKVEEGWKTLREKGLVLNDTLYNPQFLYIILTDEDIKKKCFKDAKRFGVTWITPNACVADDEEEFKNLIKSCYGR